MTPLEIAKAWAFGIVVALAWPYLVGFIAAAVADFRKWRNKWKPRS